MMSILRISHLNYKKYFSIYFFQSSQMILISSGKVKLSQTSCLEALLFSKHGKEKEAMSMIDKSLKAHPSSEKLLLAKATILLEYGTEEEVLDFINEAKKRVPDSSSLKKLEEKVQKMSTPLSEGESKIPK